MPDFIDHLGPPINYSCIRFEGYHQFFKSFKNIELKNPLHYLADRVVIQSKIDLNNPFQAGSFSYVKDNFILSKPMEYPMAGFDFYKKVNCYGT